MFAVETANKVGDINSVGIQLKEVSRVGKRSQAKLDGVKWT